MPPPTRNRTKTPRLPSRSRAAGRPPAIDSAARAVDAFRRGAAVRIKWGKAAIGALAVETVTDATLKALKVADKQPLLLLTHARARTLKIRIYTPDVVAIKPELPLHADTLRTVADPTDDLARPLKGPFDTVREPLDARHAAAVKLAKLAGLLPAAIVWRTTGEPAIESIKSGDILSYDARSAGELSVVTRARVPLEGAERTELVAFRAGSGGPEHYAIVLNAPPTDQPVLTRLHSECFTGDLLGSLKCDCGAQLRGAISEIAKAGGGILLYLAQEGRGIGLVNKLRAYRLQDQGFDTIEANERLGFEPDERLYATAARMLTLLSYKSVRLLTNNPDKVRALEAEGIPVVERVPHAFPGNPHNQGYLKTKAHKAGHLL